MSIPPELSGPDDVVGRDVEAVVPEGSGTLGVRWFGRAGTAEVLEVGNDDDEEGSGSAVGVGVDDGMATVSVVVCCMFSVVVSSSVGDGEAGVADAGIG